MARYPWALPDMYHWEFGMLDGTPSCCIQQFVNDQNNGIISGRERGSRLHSHKVEYSVYVPCDKCLEETK